MLRTPTVEDRPALIAVAVRTGLFTPGEAESLLGGVLDDFAGGRLGEGHQVLVHVDQRGGPPLGWAYYAPSFKAPGVWDLWWIGVDPEAHRQGVGTRLLEAVERAVVEAHGRLLIIETSALPLLDKARRFYVRHGYRDCGRIPDFYGDGDDKVTFARRLT